MTGSQAGGGKGGGETVGIGGSDDDWGTSRLGGTDRNKKLPLVLW
jgi:hypothetical protein